MFKLWQAFCSSCQGVFYACKEERPFRLEIVIFVILIGLNCFIPVSLLEKILLVSVWCLVLIAELLNSAVKRLCDEITQATKINIKRAKDYGSASVLLAILIALSVWVGVLYMHFIA